jgi:hypothetical protein
LSNIFCLSFLITETYFLLHFAKDSAFDVWSRDLTGVESEFFARPNRDSKLSFQQMTSSILHSRTAVSDFAPAMVFVFALLAAWKRPLAFNGVFAAAERFGTRIAQDSKAAILTLVLLPTLLRLCLLWMIPIPVPGIHDEFSYLLASDTFDHGRLTNPTHPMWTFFETIHVNQLPTYMSKYPPAQGAVLAMGQVLGHPWIGVLLSVSVMSVVALWSLRGWLPQRWAFLGALFVALRLGNFSYWGNSYWGGAVPAIGGALVIGAVPRLMRSYRNRDVVVFSLGVSILANSRPFEGFILCAAVGLTLGVAFSQYRFIARYSDFSLNCPLHGLLQLARNS